jgi:ADP-heptose:LPS heptosyltransferase
MEFLKLPSNLMPQMRVGEAIKAGVQNNILFLVHGGLGDQICAEPTLRFALENFKGPKFTLAAVTPELFRHLPFEKVYKVHKDVIPFQNHLVLATMPPTNHLNHQFMTHFGCNSVDYHSISALKMQLPVSYKRVKLSPHRPKQAIIDIGATLRGSVIIHAGNNWETRTFPKEFWDRAYDAVCEAGLRPVVIGKTMGVAPDGVKLPSYVGMKCDERGLDLRDKCSLNETIWLLQNSCSVLCSDSGPLHMAATGPANIAYLSTARHPDAITHWREGGWGWRMKNFEKGGAWSTISMCPNVDELVEADKADSETIASWLPDPKVMVDWLVTELNK